MKFLDGLRQGLSGDPEYGLPKIPTETSGPPVGSDDFPEDPQDAKQAGAEPVRTMSGALDFLQDVVVEGLDAVLDREHGEGHKDIPRKGKPIVLKTIAVPSAQWTARRITVTAAQSLPIVHQRDSRQSVRLVNMGPGIVYVGDNTVNTIAAGAAVQGGITIPVSDPVNGKYYPVVLPTRDEVWGICTGTDTAIVEVADFYGYDDADR